MRITMLGTGRAQVTRCYNTCFVLEEDGKYLLVDGGGGSGLLSQLKAANLRWQDMREIFVTHRHIDHILGIVWMMRMFTQNMKEGRIDGNAVIYGHDEVIRLLKLLAEELLQPKEAALIGERLLLREVSDGETISVMGRPMTFYDIHSTKAKQFGFVLELKDGRRVVCCGDEPCSELWRDRVRGCDWMLHESFCLYEDRDRYHPYEKHHSTVKDVCELAEELQVSNLLLYHTEDDDMENRKVRYQSEGSRYYHGDLFIPNDLESLDL